MPRHLRLLLVLVPTTNWVVSLAPGVIFGYLLSSPFGGDGCLFGGVWHIATAPWSWDRRYSTLIADVFATHLGRGLVATAP